jgi:deoxyribose-phosphate aldolase
MPKKQSVSSEEKRPFTLCPYVDLHVDDFAVDLKSVVAYSLEHGFRGILVPQIMLEECASAAKQVQPQAKLQPKIICSSDIHAMEPLEVRVCSIIVAKNAGASEIEIPLCFYHLLDQNMAALELDLQKIAEASRKYEIGLKLTFDNTNIEIPPKARKYIASLIVKNEIKCVSNRSGFEANHQNDDADTIIWLRDIKKDCRNRLMTKAYFETEDISTLSVYTKAGIENFGMPWTIAANLVHGYEEFIESQK